MCTGPPRHPGIPARSGCRPSCICRWLTRLASSHLSRFDVGLSSLIFHTATASQYLSQWWQTKRKSTSLSVGPIHIYSVLIFLLIKLRIALPFIANFAAGAIAGISEILTFYPLGIFLIYKVCLVTFTVLPRCCMCYSGFSLSIVVTRTYSRSKRGCSWTLASLKGLRELFLRLSKRKGTFADTILSCSLTKIHPSSVGRLYRGINLMIMFFIH